MTLRSSISLRIDGLDADPFRVVDPMDGSCCTETTGDTLEGCRKNEKSKTESFYGEAIEASNGGVESSRRKVHFGPNVHVKTIPHFKDMPDKIVQATWYDRQDYKTIQRGFSETLCFLPCIHLDNENEMDNEMENSWFDASAALSTRRCRKYLETDDHCIRGLESRTDQGRRRRNRLRMRTIRAVLCEQERQRNSAFCYHNSLALPVRAKDSTNDAITRVECATTDRQATRRRNRTSSLPGCEAIAEAYRQAGAADSQKLAVVLGMQDASIVWDYLSIERISWGKGRSTSTENLETKAAAIAGTSDPHLWSSLAFPIDASMNPSCIEDVSSMLLDDGYAATMSSDASMGSSDVLTATEDCALASPGVGQCIAIAVATS